MRLVPVSSGVLALSLLLLASPARADDILVPGDYRDLQDAVDAATPGDRVLVRRARVRRPVVVRTPGIEIVAERGTFRTRDAVGLTVDAAGVAVRGFRFRRCGILVTAADAVVEGNEFVRPRDPGVLRSQGPRATVRGNTVSRVNGAGFDNTGAILVRGDGSFVEGNRVERIVRADGIQAFGTGIAIRDNGISFVAAGAGILVEGSDFTVEGNRLAGVGQIAGARVVTSDPMIGGGNGPKWNTYRACPGIQVRATSPGGVVAGNRVEHAASEGFDLDLDGAAVTDNEEAFVGDGSAVAAGMVVRGAGNRVTGNRLHGGSLKLAEEGDWERIDGRYTWVVAGGSNLVAGNRIDFHRAGVDAVLVAGDGNAVEDNEVTGGASDREAGFRITGSFNTLRGNRVEGAGGIGFQVAPLAAGNSLEGCTATGSAGCGLMNSGDGTCVTGGTFLLSGVADVRNRGNFALFEGNTFETGGPDPLPPEEWDYLVDF